MNELFTADGRGDKKSLVYLVIVFTLSALILQILLYLKGFYSVSADESGRTLLAFHWLNGTEPPGEPWLPFHKVITALALKIYPNLFLAPRISGAIFSLLSIAVFVYYSHEVFRNRQITLLASLIGLLFPPFVIIRAVPLAESIYIFFIVAGSLFFLKYLKSEKNLYLTSASCMFAFSSSVRYEGWLFTLCLLFYMLLKHKRISREIIVINSLLLAAFPLYWIIANYIDYGNLFYFVYSTSEGYKLHHDTFMMLLKYNLVTQFLYQNIIYLNAGAVISVIFMILIKKEIRVFILFLFSVFLLLACLSFAEIGMPSHAFWRIPLSWSILLIPFSIHFIIKFSEFLSDYFKKKKKFFIIGISAVIIIYFLFQVNRLSSRSMFTADEKNTGEYIAENCAGEKADKILIDSSGWEYLNIIVASNQPYLFIPNAGDNPALPGKPLVSPVSKLNAEVLKEMKIKCLVFERDDYKNYLDKNDHVRLEKKFGIWKIYSVR